MNPYFVEWKFKPENFFEYSFSENHEGICLDFGMGTIEGCLGCIEYEAAEILLQKLHPHVERIFQSTQPLSYLRYNLCCGMVFQKKPDGTRKIPISVSIGTANSGDLETSLFSIESNIGIERDGQTVWCAEEERIKRKQERINRNQENLVLMQKHKEDPVLQKLLKSLHQAVNDSENEFIYLYEIYDALLTKFGRKKMPQVLGLSEEDHCNQFVKLTNNKAYSQGRHRGQSPIDKIESAPQSELNQAREIARTFIMSYLKYLDKILN